MTKAIGSKNIRHRTLRMVMIAVFVALIAVGAFIKVPIGIVPVSLQLAMAMLCALLLGPWDSLICISVYLAMGLIGIPVFTAGGGPGYVFQPTFGYLLGYLLALPVCGVIARGVRCEARPRFIRALIGAFAAIAIVYTAGVAYMYLMLKFYAGSDITLSRAIVTGAAVFLPTDITFAVLASLICVRVAPVLARFTYTVRKRGKTSFNELYFSCEYSPVYTEQDI